MGDGEEQTVRVGLQGRLGQGSEGRQEPPSGPRSLLRGRGSLSAPPVTRWVENWWLTAWGGSQPTHGAPWGQEGLLVSAPGVSAGGWYLAQNPWDSSLARHPQSPALLESGPVTCWPRGLTHWLPRV